MKISQRGLFTALYGNHDDFYIDDDLKRYSLWQQLYLYLKEENFDIVLLYDNNNNFHSYCKSDLVGFLNLNSEIRKKEQKNKKNSYRASNINSPLRGLRKSSVIAEEPVFLNNENDNYHYIYDSPLHADDGFFKLRNLAQVFEHISRIFKDSTKKSALIIKSPGHTIFQNQENYTTLFNYLKDEYERYNLNNKILIVYECSDQNALSYHFQAYSNLLFSSHYFRNIFVRNIESPVKLNESTTFFIDKPDQTESLNIINEFRLEKLLPTKFQEFDLIVDGIFKKKLTTKEVCNKLNNALPQSVSLEEFIRTQIILPPNIDVNERVLTDNLNKVVGQSGIAPFIVKKLKLHFNLSKRTSPVSFFLVGTSGVGKTYTAKLIAESLSKSGFQFVHLNMNEFQTEETANKLIGSPPGFIGSETAPRLFSELDKSSRLVILFDEIEKAHERVIVTLMQLLDEGKLSWNQHVGDFKDCIIIFTSNAEQRKFVAFKDEFLKTYTGDLKKAFDDARYKHRMKDILTQSSGGKQFRPEVSGRIGNYLVYSPLKSTDIIKVSFQSAWNFAASEYEMKINTIQPEILGRWAFDFSESPYGLRDLDKEVKNVVSSILDHITSKSSYYELALDHSGQAYVLHKSTIDGSLSSEEIDRLFDKANQHYKKLVKQAKELNTDKIALALQKVIGQLDSQEPILSSLKVWFRKKAKPLNFFLVGPSGVGKTETVKQLTSALSFKGYEMHRINCNELRDEVAINKIIGSPPGYLGSEQEPELFRKHRLNNKLIILFDEIEKAHPAIFTTIMGLLDEGLLAWNNDERNFSRCILFFTSNLAQGILTTQKSKLLSREISTNDAEFQKEIKGIIENEFRKNNLGSEIVGRIQKVLVYNPLSKQDIFSIAWQIIKKIAAEQRKVIIEMDESILTILSEQYSNLSTGARPLVDYLEEFLYAAFAELEDDEDEDELKPVAIKNTSKNGKLKFQVTISDLSIESEYTPIFEDVSTIVNVSQAMHNNPTPGQDKDVQMTIVTNNEKHDLIQSIGLIKTDDGRGTGFLISKEGHFITANHVVNNSNACLFYYWLTKTDYETKLLWSDLAIDVAIFKIVSDKTDFIPLNINTENEAPKILEEVLLAGYPMGGMLSETPYVSPSTISNYEQGLALSEKYKFDAIVTYTNATEGYSGGPLIRKVDGKVIGILHGGLPDKGNINFASDIRQLFKAKALKLDIVDT